jgi:hypothetical protein
MNPTCPYRTTRLFAVLGRSPTILRISRGRMRESPGSSDGVAVPVHRPVPARSQPHAAAELTGSEVRITPAHLARDPGDRRVCSAQKAGHLLGPQHRQVRDRGLSGEESVQARHTGSRRSPARRDDRARVTLCCGRSAGSRWSRSTWPFQAAGHRDADQASIENSQPTDCQTISSDTLLVSRQLRSATDCGGAP